jgi:hypothetical protein
VVWKDVLMAVLYAVDGTREKISLETAGILTLKEAWAIVGGWLQAVGLDHDAPGFLLVDEEGRLKGLPHNPGASTLAGQSIVGPAILTNKKEFD